PDACGAAMEVPLMPRVPVPAPEAATMPTPGAARSGTRVPTRGAGPRELKPAITPALLALRSCEVAATASTQGAVAGDAMVIGPGPPLPAAATPRMPAARTPRNASAKVSTATPSSLQSTPTHTQGSVPKPPIE